MFLTENSIGTGSPALRSLLSDCMLSVKVGMGEGDSDTGADGVANAQAANMRAIARMITSGLFMRVPWYCVHGTTIPAPEESRTSIYPRFSTIDTGDFVQ